MGRGIHRSTRRWPLLVGLAVVGATVVAVVALELRPSAPRADRFALPLPSDTQPLPDSGRLVSDLVTDAHNDYGTVGVNLEPVLTVSADQPRVPVRVTDGCNDFLGQTGTTVPIPSDAPRMGTVDDPLVIDQPSTHTEWELWRARRSVGGAWSACWGGRLRTTGSGVFPYPYGLAASGISYLDTDITEADVASGVIRHAIALQMPTCTSPPVPPADRTDCHPTPGQPPYGTYYRFPAGLAVPRGLNPFARMVFVAVQRYGMVLTDQAGAVMLVAETPADWVAMGHRGTDPLTASWKGLPEYRVIANLPWDRLVAVRGPG